MQRENPTKRKLPQDGFLTDETPQQKRKMAAENEEPEIEENQQSDVDFYETAEQEAIKEECNSCMIAYARRQEQELQKLYQELQINEASRRELQSKDAELQETISTLTSKITGLTKNSDEFVKITEVIRSHVEANDQKLEQLEQRTQSTESKLGQIVTMAQQLRGKMQEDKRKEDMETCRKVAESVKIAMQRLEAHSQQSKAMEADVKQIAENYEDACKSEEELQRQFSEVKEKFTEFQQTESSLEAKLQAAKARILLLEAENKDMVFGEELHEEEMVAIHKKLSEAEAALKNKTEEAKQTAMMVKKQLDDMAAMQQNMATMEATLKAQTDEIARLNAASTVAKKDIDDSTLLKQKLAAVESALKVKIEECSRLELAGKLEREAHEVLKNQLEQLQTQIQSSVDDKRTPAEQSDTIEGIEINNVQALGNDEEKENIIDIPDSPQISPLSTNEISVIEPTSSGSPIKFSVPRTPCRQKDSSVHTSRKRSNVKSGRDQIAPYQAPKPRNPQESPFAFGNLNKLPEILVGFGKSSKPTKPINPIVPMTKSDGNGQTFNGDYFDRLRSDINTRKK